MAHTVESDEQEALVVGGGRVTRSHSSAALRWLPWLVFAAGLTGQAAVLLVQDRRLWFFRDDFGYLLTRNLSQHPVDSLLMPHSVHWSTLPVIAFRVMWQLFGMRHYLPYALMPLLLHLAVAVCLALLARRAGAGAWPAVLSALVFAYLGGGAGAEDPLWASQIGFIGSCLGGFVALICFDLSLAHPEDRSGRHWFWIGEVFLVAALMCSGMGLAMVVTAGVWTLLRRGPAAAVRIVVLPAVVFAAWYVGWGHTALNSQPIGVGLVHGPPAAAIAIGQVWSAATALPAASGPVVLFVLVVAVVWTRHQPPLRALGIAGLVGLAFEYLLIAFGRANLDANLHSRYVYVGLALSTPAVASLLELAAGRMRDLPRVTAGAWLVAAVLVVVLGATETAQYAAQRRASDPARKQELLAAAALIHRRAPLLSDRIDPFDSSRDPAMSVANLKAAHALAELPPGQPSSAALFDERSVLQVDIRDATMNVLPAKTYHWSDHWTGAAAADLASRRRADALRGCTARTATSLVRLEVPLGAHGGQVQITYQPQDRNDPAVVTRILQRGRTSIPSRYELDARWNLAGPQFFVASTVRHATLQVAFPAGHVEVCGAR